METESLVISTPITAFYLIAVRQEGHLVLKESGYTAPSGMFTSAPSLQLREWGRRAADYFRGDPVDFTGIPLDTGALTPFGGEIIRAARQVAWGTTCSYAELAEKAGHHGAFRAAATVMRQNRFPLIVPCHRIIRSNGGIGGFMGSGKGRPVELKANLLALEGVALS